MSDYHVYFGIENLALSASQKAQLVAALKALGPATHPRPCMLNHWRTRLDGDAAFFEALFDETKITIQALKNFLGTIFGINPNLITNTNSSQSFGGHSTLVVTFTYNAINYLRVALFGYSGGWPSYSDSHDEVLGYLKLNQAQWEPIV
jgi:hypothetical protein